MNQETAVANLLASGFGVLEEMQEALVDALDGPEEFLNPHRFASNFVCGRVRGNGVAELSGAANALSGQQGEHRLRILLPRLALLPFLNGPSGLADVVHGIAEFPEDARIDGALAHVVLQLDKVGASLL
jgi:hypothetical protein